MTFSIAARCSRTGMFGVGVSTAVPAVGSLVPFSVPRVGAVATQSWVNVYLGIDGVAALRAGHDAQAVLDLVLGKDPGRDMRQLGVVDAEGRSAAFTGNDCIGWAGHLTGTDFAVQGNMLTGGETLEGMQHAFVSSSEEDFPERLMRALEGGQRAGGDKRGRQSAALLVYYEEEYPYLSCRVDEHSDPVAELRRIWEVSKRQLMPFIDTLPTREDPIGRHSPAVAEFMLLSPHEREKEG